MPVKTKNSGALFTLCKNAASFAAYSIAIILTGNASFAAALHNAR